VMIEGPDKRRIQTMADGIADEARSDLKSA
jgi:hypothetical protein